MKLSETLKIAQKYHMAFGGRSGGMCIALRDAYVKSEIDALDYSFGVEFCSTLVREIDPRADYLEEALYLKGFLRTDTTLRQIWTAVIDKLESEGK